MISTYELCMAMPCPLSVAVEWAPLLSKAMETYHINTPNRITGFLAQISHESAQLSHFEENLDYSAERLMQVWKSRFPTLEIARAYEHNPQKLANFVYANRLGNGDEASGDGWDFRGKGPIQITGRRNHERCAIALNLALVQYPGLLLIPEHGANSAGWYWEDAGCNAMMDDNNFKAATVAVAGALTGYDQRVYAWNMVRDVLGVS